MVYIFGALLIGPHTYSSWVFSVRLRMFDLSNLGPDRSKDVTGRTQIHPIWRIWWFRRGVFVSLLCQTSSFALTRRMMTRWLFCVIVRYPPIIFLWCLSVWEMWTIFPSYQTAWPQWLWRCCWVHWGCRWWWYPVDNVSERLYDVELCRCLCCYDKVEYLCEGLVWHVEVPWEVVCDDFFFTFNVLWIYGCLVTYKVPTKTTGYVVVTFFI